MNKRIYECMTEYGYFYVGIERKINLRCVIVILSDSERFCLTNLPQPLFIKRGEGLFPLDKGDTAKPRGFV
ncbi:hypothetical protein J6T66_00415 [bacterium]|nr:hypothetical protein [bacterium]